MTSSHHGPYDQGYTRATMAHTKRSDLARAVMLQLCYVWGWLTAPGGCHYVKSLHGLSSMTLQHYLTWLS